MFLIQKRILSKKAILRRLNISNIQGSIIDVVLAVNGAVAAATVKINTKTYNIKTGGISAGDSLLLTAPVDGNTNPYINIAGGYAVTVAITGGATADVVAYVEDY